MHMVEGKDVTSSKGASSVLGQTSGDRGGRQRTLPRFRSTRFFTSVAHFRTPSTCSSTPHRAMPRPPPRSSAHATRHTSLSYPSEKKLPSPLSRPRVHLLSGVQLLRPSGKSPSVHLPKGGVSACGTSFRARGRVDGDARSYGAHFCARQHARWQRLVDVSHERQQGADEGEELHVPGAEACGWLEATSKERAGGGPHVCFHGVCSNEAMRSRKEEEKRWNEWKERRRGRGWTARADQTRVLQVVVNEGEPPESALRRFRRAVMSSGVIPEVRG